MTTAQKVIKYIATAFAVFLIITIMSAILSGGYALLSAFGLIHTNKNIVTEDLKVISSEVKEISTLKIDLAFTNLDIKTGDKFKVETNNSKITFTNDNGIMTSTCMFDLTQYDATDEITLHLEYKGNKADIVLQKVNK